MPIAFFPLLVLLCAFIFGTAHVRAAESVAEPVVEGENWTARFQTTYIWQRKPGFDAAYSGQNSLLANREKSYTFTDRKSTRLNSSHIPLSRMPSSA